MAAIETVGDSGDPRLADYVRLTETSTAEATAAVIAGFPENRLVTILVGDASQISTPVGALGIGDVEVVTG